MTKLTYQKYSINPDIKIIEITKLFKSVSKNIWFRVFKKHYSKSKQSKKTDLKNFTQFLLFVLTN